MVSLPLSRSDLQMGDLRQPNAKSDNVQRLLLITARLEIQVEEEDRMGLPKALARKAGDR